MAKLILKGWEEGLKKVSLAILLKERTSLTLAPAKDCVDRLLDGETVCIEVVSIDEARQLAKEISSLGAICEVHEEGNKRVKN